MTSAERRERNSERWQAMETPVYDLADMAHVTAQVWGDYQKELKGFAELQGCTGPDLIEHIKTWQRSVDFMLMRLEDMAEKMLEYYE